MRKVVKKIARRGKGLEVAFSAEQPAGTMVTSVEVLVPGGRPQKLKDVFKRNRELSGQVEERAANSWVSEWLRVRALCFNDGFSTFEPQIAAPVRAEKRADGRRAKVEWLDQVRGRSTARAVLGRLNEDLWSEWLLQDNAVVFWMAVGTFISGRGLPEPVVLDAEICEYRNDLGGEVLTIRPGKRKLSETEKEALEATPGGARWVAAYEKGDAVVVDAKAREEYGENFAVLTRAKRGKGMGIPRLRAMYGLLQVLEHLQTGDASGAFWARDVIRQWLVGFEPRTDDLAKMENLYKMTPGKMRALTEGKKNKRGSWELATNFDVAMKWLFADPAMFAADKYKGTLGQLDRWGGPAMAMAMTGQAAPHLLTALAAEGRSERGLVGAFLEELAGRSDFFGKPVRVSWNANTFMDHKTMLERLRTGGANGAVSVTTQREWLGVDNEEEGRRLQLELKTPERYRPGFEPKQGMLAGEGGDGRPREKVQDLAQT